MRVDAQSKAEAGAEPKLPQLGQVDKQTFLKLLVAQIRNQDPLNPADGTEFLTQLAQFSELEQMIGIREGIEQLRDKPNPPEQGGK